MKKQLCLCLMALLLLVTALTLASCGEDPLAGVSFNGATFAYDGLPHTIEVSGLPEGATVSYLPSNTQTEAGNYPIEATVTLGKDTRILKATLTVSYPKDIASGSDLEGIDNRILTESCQIRRILGEVRAPRDHKNVKSQAVALFECKLA